jgi:DNA polymerase/3'-5' exonuclease PolX
MELKRAASIALRTLQIVRPSCERFLIAGSIRRRKPDVGDIELLLIPKELVQRGPGELLPTMHKPLYPLLDDLCDRPHTPYSRGPQATRRWGEKFRRLHYAAGGETIAIDVFIVEEQAWGPQLAIRTGPADLSKRLVSPRPWGAMPKYHRMRGGLIVCYDEDIGAERGVPVPLPEESDFFKFCGLPHCPPELRTVDWLDRELSR